VRIRQSNGRSPPGLPCLKSDNAAVRSHARTLAGHPFIEQFSRSRTRRSVTRLINNGSELPPVARRTNGLAPEAPQPGQLVLVTGGAGYIGSVLTRRLLDRGYRVRILDRLYWGRGPIGEILDHVELIDADVRDMPTTALDGVDAVIHLAGLSNDPTAEYDPQANWQMNAVATETLGRNCVDRDVERLVFASSCSLYDGMPPGMHDETAAIKPRGAYATSKRFGEESLIALADQGLCPVMLRNGTVYGYSPRMRFDLVVNTFVKDALLRGQLSLHGGGWMWRPLVDVRDVSDAMIAAMEAPAELVRGEIFNVLHSNYQIRELAMLVAGSVQLLGRSVTLREEPAPRLTRDYECSNTKLASRLGFQPSHSVVEAIDGILASVDVEDKTMLTDPRHYNIRWLELLSEVMPQIDQYKAAL
jgi:nucleoside-diphosphate-sugar epimerase